MKKIETRIDLSRDVDFKKAKEKSTTFWKEFKDFATKGNLIDMAVGVVVGTAFSKIVTSLVNDIVMPLISMLTGKVDFSNMFISLDGTNYETLAKAQEVGASTINYGSFITTIINFLIIAFSIFVVIKNFSLFKKKEEAKVEEKVVMKTCKYCRSEIHIDATRCPYCTSMQEE